MLTTKSSSFDATELAERQWNTLSLLAQLGDGRFLPRGGILEKSHKTQFKSSLNPAAWEDLEGTIRAAAAAASKADETINSAEQRFYRVLLAPNDAFCVFPARCGRQSSKTGNSRASAVARVRAIQV
jgi:hypothetical protein